MSANSPINSENQEIDLNQISKKLGSLLDYFLSLIFEGILFLKSKIIILSILFILGLGLGFYIDSTSRSYNHEIIITPNFGSTDYLYAKIELLNSKIKEKESGFFKKLGIKDSESILLIEIEPVIDIYSFVNESGSAANNAQNTQNFELVKLLSESSDINKVIKDKVTSKNYSSHVIHIQTDKKIINEDMVAQLLKYINKSDYFQKIQKVYITNTKEKMAKNEIIINQIDGLLNEFVSSATTNQRNEKLVYYNENTQLNEIIKTKDYLINELGGLKMNLANFNDIITVKSSISNIPNDKGLNGKMKLVLPFLFIFFFVLFTIIKLFYLNQLSKFKKN